MAKVLTSTINRDDKGSALTHVEHDANHALVGGVREVINVEFTVPDTTNQYEVPIFKLVSPMPVNTFRCRVHIEYIEVLDDGSTMYIGDEYHDDVVWNSGFSTDQGMQLDCSENGSDVDVVYVHTGQAGYSDKSATVKASFSILSPVDIVPNTADNVQQY